MKKKWKSWFKTGIIGVPLIAIVGIFIFPIFWFFLLSIKPGKIAFAVPPVFIFKPTIEAYTELFVRQGKYSYIMNSLIVAIANTMLTMVIALPAAYAFSRYDLRQKESLFFFILFLRMLPEVALILPFYLMMKAIGMVGTRISLVLICLTFNVPLAVWIMRGFIQKIPKEIDESALIDGCSRIGAVVRVILPLCTPGLLVTSSFCFIFSWNEFMYALVLTSQEIQTLPVASAAFWTKIVFWWPQLSAMATATVIPPLVITIVLRKYMIRGLTFGAIK